MDDTQRLENFRALFLSIAEGKNDTYQNIDELLTAIVANAKGTLDDLLSGGTQVITAKLEAERDAIQAKIDVIQTKAGA